MQEPGGSRSCWQKFSILKPRNIRTRLDKQDQTGSYVGVTFEFHCIRSSCLYMYSEISCVGLIMSRTGVGPS